MMRKKESIMGGARADGVPELRIADTMSALLEVSIDIRDALVEIGDQLDSMPRNRTETDMSETDAPPCDGCTMLEMQLAERDDAFVESGDTIWKLSDRARAAETERDAALATAVHYAVLAGMQDDVEREVALRFLAILDRKPGPMVTRLPTQKKSFMAVGDQFIAADIVSEADRKP